MNEILSPENYTSIFNLIIEFAPRILLGIVFLFIGLRIIKRSINVLEKFLNSKKIDKSLIPFFRSLLSITLQIALIISVLSMVGVEMTSFLAILGAAGLAVGLALKDTLQNFAAGVMILFFKPFKVGDFIEYEGTKGTVKEIQIFNSILTTIDNKRVIIPNGILQTSIVTNFSTEGTYLNSKRSQLCFWIYNRYEFIISCFIVLGFICNFNRFYNFIDINRCDLILIIYLYYSLNLNTVFL